MTPTHPDACASCGCVRRHAHWCRLVPCPWPLPRLDRDEARELADHDGETAADHDGETAAAWAEFVAGHAS